MVAVPEVAGVHWRTCSGLLAVADAAQDPESALAADVVPVNVPPAPGMTSGLAHVPAGRVVVVVAVVEVVVDVVVVGGSVVVVGGSVVVVVGG